MTCTLAQSHRLAYLREAAEANLRASGVLKKCKLKLGPHCQLCVTLTEHTPV